MIRIFADGQAGTGASITLSGEKAHYLSAVLRCKAGDTIIITDSTGSVYNARLTTLTRKQATLAVGKPCAPVPESPLEIIVLQGLLKGEKMDLVIQKATELGVKQIIPVITERSQLRETRKTERWKKIAEEASRQCGRASIPFIEEPLDFMRALPGSSGANVCGIIFWEREGAPFSSVLKQFGETKRIMLCIGPEGGFSEKEARTAADRGFVITSLGKRILRAETAAIAALAIVQFGLGDMGTVS